MKATTTDQVRKASELFFKNYDFIKKTIHCQIRDEHAAEDIFQNFFVSIAERPFPETLQSLHAYLSRSIRNDIIDAARKKQIRKKHLARFYKKTLNKPQANLTPPELLMQQETMDVIFATARENLPLCQYKAIKFRYLQGLNVDQTAKKMSVNKRTVSRYVSVGLKKLSEKLPPRIAENNQCA